MLLEACDVTNNGCHFDFYQELEKRLKPREKKKKRKMMMAAFLKLDSLCYLLPFCVFKYFTFFRVRVPVLEFLLSFI